ncbi:G-type lectin S-receptor-like serine/threonine-protein kinase At4g27290 [Rutidosis leptorrhynchoides]|uniref:G-type lectin S-receptor-like serine/threonine-protein kinase At4g27290 n=1 Tax=Rutidosis leptorrhynchoides TaxID=125765 RepID=UPI003A993BA3
MRTLLLLVLLNLFFFLNLQTSFSTDTLKPKEYFVDGFTLISSNQRFEFGFFSPGNGSSGNLYLGIWYYNLPLTVVWVANRNNPIRDSFGQVTLTENGVLTLYNRSLGSVWSTNKLPIDSTFTPVLQLLDSGNLVIRDDGRNKTVFWESFDYPTDTLLPDSKLGLNRFITSWKNSEDASEGDFSFSLDPPEAPQLVVRSGSKKLFRWGPFDGSEFSGMDTITTNSLFQTVYVYNKQDQYFKYEMLDDSIMPRLVISPMGLIQYFTWRVNISKEWNSLATINSDPCDNYAKCGVYGSCYSLSACKCLSGFTPASPKDWGLYSYAGGCRRKHELNCSRHDGFVKYSGLKFPDNPSVLGNYTDHECEARCLKNCSCMAYANVVPYGNGSYCVVWIGDLVDLKYFPNGGDQINIRMARAELNSIAGAKRKRIRIKIVSVVTVLVILFLTAGVILYFGWIIRQRRKDRISRNSKAQHSGSFQYVEDQDSGFQLPLYDLETLLLACNNFSERNKIGQGGFGSVYKGELSNGQEIAVKRLAEKSLQGVEELKNEIILIGKLQHRNLVKLLGCCIEGDETMLVYEYLPNKSLNNFIYDKPRRRQLTWRKRYHIIKGIARGLLYLHQDSRLRIIHRDLKTSNILLDSELNPKISDFGIARIFGTNQIQEMTKRIIGTYGYMSPEYAMNGHYSVKSDVYSFGVIVLEIISSQKNWAFHHPDHDLNLLGHTWMLWNKRRPLEMLDPIIQEPSFSEQVTRCIHVALLCVQQYPEDRPKMSTVYAMLSYDNMELPEPKEPGFCRESNPRKFDTSPSDSSTVNEVTMTTMGGR